VLLVTKESNLINYTQLSKANRMRVKLENKNTVYDRIHTTLASHNIPHIRRVMRRLVDSRKASPELIESMLHRAIAGTYRPRIPQNVAESSSSTLGKRGRGEVDARTLMATPKAKGE
jgi:hypothetical protein